MDQKRIIAMAEAIHANHEDHPVFSCAKAVYDRGLARSLLRDFDARWPGEARPQPLVVTKDEANAIVDRGPVRVTGYVEPRSLSDRLDVLESVMHPEGRCRECGGGKPYWMHDAAEAISSRVPEAYHEFVPMEVPDAP